MNILKRSFFPIALSSIVLFASITPALGARRVRAKVSQPSRAVPKPAVDTPAEKNPKKKNLTWKQMVRTKCREIYKYVKKHPVQSVFAAVGTILATWFLWDKLSNPWILREAVVGNSACDIQEVVVPQGEQRQIINQELNQVANFRLNNPAQIIQLRSANQALGGSCAYHATKNCIVMLNELANPQGDLQLQLEGDELCERLFGFQNGIWRARVLGNARYLANNHCRENGDWLSGDVVRDFINHEFDNHEFLNQAYQRDIRQVREAELLPDGEFVRDERGNIRHLNVDENHSQITVIEDTIFINNPDHRLNLTRIARAHLAHALQAGEEYIHGFIFNTARTVNGRVPPRDNGHWMAAVLHCTGREIRWYVANSSWQRAMFNYPSLRDLIAAVQGEQV